MIAFCAATGGSYGVLFTDITLTENFYANSYIKDHLVFKLVLFLKGRIPRSVTDTPW